MAFRNILFVACAVWCWSCAQQGSPSGGPRDETPPRVLECDPPNYSTRFKENKILITFDEYVVLENANQELIVSPPLEEKPEVRLRKKTVVIQFDEALKENTTYTFHFGRAIKDLHEGNELLNYEYVFSTGDILDSLSVRGILRVAEDLSFPKDPVAIMLYTRLGDSVPMTEPPLYVGRTGDSGVFSVNNLRPDEYKLFALKDGNNNLLFDLPTEEIAFLDSSLTLNADFTRKLLEASGKLIAPGADSLSREKDIPLQNANAPPREADTLSQESDTLPEPGPELNALYVDLYLFTEETDIQYIVDNTREDRRKIELVFARPLTDSFSYHFLTPDLDRPGALVKYFSPERDSLILWLVDSTDYKKDTLIMELDYMAKDTSDLDVLKTDTLSFIFRERRESSRRPAKTEKSSEKLQLTTLRNNGSLDLNRDPSFTLDLPLKAIHDSLISVFRLEDSLEIEEPFGTYVDTTSLYRGWVRADWAPDTRYRIQLLPGAFTSIYPVQHDTINLRFTTRDTEYYGQIILNLKGADGPVLIQLISKEKVVGQQAVFSAGTYLFPFLAPQEYRIKFIHDRNRNGEWDTGNYLKHLQPEEVEYLPGSVTVRSNWDHEITMQLER
ncbi:MAG: Ig-like domain-containing protein [Bacteroidales bacterium]